MEGLKQLVGEKFAKKKDLLELNMRCIEEGFRFTDPKSGAVSFSLPAPKEEWKGKLLITGSQAMALGAVHAGVRFYAGYPMTPSSPILTYIAETQNKTCIAVKQAEDEITAAQMVCGAALMGTRALTATAGGGFDLMTETLSLAGMLEDPAVFIIAQRPGPATGQPTWTAQADLLMAVHGAHGEFPRCVLAASGADDSFTLMADAFNIAEEFQLPVLVLTDKQIAEALYTQAPFDQSKTKLERGALVTKPADLKKLSSADRYAVNVENGVSPRWVPGSDAPVYCAQGDEHLPDGTSDDSASNAKAQMIKRMTKLHALKEKLPEPELIGCEEPEILLVGWGSTKTAVEDALRDPQFKDKKIGYLHFSYLWPLKTERFGFLARKAKQVILIEGNCQGQLGMLLRQECGIAVSYRILKFDGRPFFVDELVERLQSHLAMPSAATVPVSSSRSRKKS
jgi:2-oxoglutarate ferredoxin oxidoreductase subunit alpha